MGYRRRPYMLLGWVMCLTCLVTMASMDPGKPHWVKAEYASKYSKVANKDALGPEITNPRENISSSGNEAYTSLSKVRHSVGLCRPTRRDKRAHDDDDHGDCDHHGGDNHEDLDKPLEQMKLSTYTADQPLASAMQCVYKSLKKMGPGDEGIVFTWLLAGQRRPVANARTL
ncbi:hypothetical protein P43SY_001837 [Pythium insidiosum]|uniref:Secreted protein n=1 Tax=Pythium insidiosum TaxID=114742 RepID=A0AAD5Q1Q5_PYTIN|nr:hypothetical protein P43SY_001837 [Pythium insidiosum]